MTLGYFTQQIHLSHAKLQKNSSGRSSTVQARTRGYHGLRLIDRFRPSSLSPVVDCPSSVDRIVLCAHEKFKTLLEREKKVLKVMVSQVETASVCNWWSVRLSHGLGVLSSKWQWCRLAVTGIERRCWQCSGQLMVAERCYPIAIERPRPPHLRDIWRKHLSNFCSSWRTDRSAYMFDGCQAREVWMFSLNTLGYGACASGTELCWLFALRHVIQNSMGAVCIMNLSIDL